MDKKQIVSWITLLCGVALVCSSFLVSFDVSGSYTATPKGSDLYENTLVVSGGEPFGKIVPFFYSEYSENWLALFNPNVIPYLELDANGELTFVFTSGTNFSEYDTRIVVVEAGVEWVPPDVDENVEFDEDIISGVSADIYLGSTLLMIVGLVCACPSGGYLVYNKFLD